MEDKSSMDYWMQRELENLELFDKEISPVLKVMKRYYLNAFNEIKRELKVYRHDNKEYNEVIFSNTLERIKAIINAIGEFENTHTENNLRGFYNTNKLRVEKYLKQSNIPVNELKFNVPNYKAVEIMLKEKVAGHHFSKRIWKNTDMLAFNVESVIVDGLIRGDSYGKMANQLNARMGAGYSNSSRLIRTECKRAVDKSKIDTYEQAGIEKLQLITAGDDRVCSICKAKNGHIFKPGEAIPGVDYLIHSNDRCCIIPLVEFD